MALRFTRHRAAKRQEHQAEEKTVQQMRLRRRKADEAETDRFVSLYDPAVLHFDGTYGWLAAAVVAAGSKKSYDFCIYPVFAGAAGFGLRADIILKTGLKKSVASLSEYGSLIALGSRARHLCMASSDLQNRLGLFHRRYGYGRDLWHEFVF